MKTNTNQPRATASAGAPRLHSIESSGRKQFGAHLVPKASGAAVTTPASDTLNQRGGAFARHLNKAATGPQRSHHRAHQQPKWQFWDRIRHVYEGLELAPTPAALAPWTPWPCPVAWATGCITGMDALHKYAPRPLAADMKKARMHPHKTWSAEDDALLRNTFPHHATQVVAAILGRTTPAVASHARALGLRKTHAYRAATARRTTRKRSPWTPQIEELMVLLYPYCITHQLEDLFGIPSVAIRQKALYMGLKKNTAAKRHIAQMRNLTLRQAAQAAGPGPSASTQVRARNKNRTAKGGGKTTIQPIGTVRLRTWSGVPNTLVEKVGLPSQWRQVHQLVWEHANGRPIPKGFVVTFRDKNRFNLNPENLELVSRSEWSLRVSPLCSADACPELKYITRLRGTLSRVTRQAEQRLQRSSTTPGAAGA